MEKSTIFREIYGFTKEVTKGGDLTEIFERDRVL